MRKYAGLARFLRNLDGDRYEAVFENLEREAGVKLPPSAFKHRPWWSNNPGHSQSSHGWLAAGWIVETVDTGLHRVRFARGKRPQRPPAGDQPLPALEAYFGTPLRPSPHPLTQHTLDFVSAGYDIVGEARLFSTPHGRAISSSQLALISHTVWLLEKAPARRRFLAAMGDVDVPLAWIGKYSALSQNVEFLYVTDSHRVLPIGEAR